MDSNKKKVLEHLQLTKGIVTYACHNSNLARSTFYDWCANDPEFKAAVDEINETAIDFVESKLMEKIDGISVAVETKAGQVVYEQPPSDTAIIFFLKTRGKKRGYVERSEIDHSGGVSLHFDSQDEQIGSDVPKD